jgi:hypothetical protein
MEAIAWGCAPNGDFVVYVLRSPRNGVHPVLVRRDTLHGTEWREGEWLICASPWTRTPAEWEAYHRKRGRGTAFVPSGATLLDVVKAIADRRSQLTEFCAAARARENARFRGADLITYKELTDDLQ